MAESTSRKLLRIHKDDNVLIVVNPVQPGDKEVVDGREITFDECIPIGHKVACRLIRKAEKIYKCGVPIGSAKQDISAGAHIHLHNLKSDYLKTYTLDKERVYVK